MFYHPFFRPGYRVIIPFLLVLVIAVACGGGTTPMAGVPPTDTPQPTATATAVPSTPTPEPTATLRPGETPEPTSTPTPRPTPLPTPTIAATVVPTPTVRPTPTQAPVVGKPVVTRLAVAVQPPAQQSPLDCGTQGVAQFQHRPAMDLLLSLDRYTGERIPQLATEWSISPDGKDWTFKLREGVPWHFGFGEFTAHDAVNSRQIFVEADCRASDTPYFRDDPGVQVEAIDDHTVVFRLVKRPDILFNDKVGLRSGWPITSKAQWDQACPNAPEGYGDLGFCKAGEDGVAAKPARTGPYQFVSFTENVGYLYERVPYEHWRLQPDFEQLNMRFIREPATRLAAMVTKQVHLSSLPNNLLDQAIAAGLDTSLSTFPALGPHYMFGGLYYDDEIRESLDTSYPWAAEGDVGRKVRQAMNKAIDRDQLNKAFFQGRGRPMYVAGVDPTIRGYIPAWEQRFEEAYGFDQARARELLTEAGFPNGFETTLLGYATPGVPEMADVAEAIAGMWEAVGIKVSLDDREYGRWRQEYRELRSNCCVYSFSVAPLEPNIMIYFWWMPGRIFRGYTSNTLSANFRTAGEVLTQEGQTPFFQAIHEELYNEFSHIPLFYLPGIVTIDPDVVADYTWWGIAGGLHSQLEYVSVVRE